MYTSKAKLCAGEWTVPHNKPWLPTLKSILQTWWWRQTTPILWKQDADREGFQMAGMMFSSHSFVSLIQTFSTSRFLNVLLDESWSLNCSQSWGVTRHASWRGPSRFFHSFRINHEPVKMPCMDLNPSPTDPAAWRAAGTDLLLQFCQTYRNSMLVLTLYRFTPMGLFTVASLLLLESKRANERAWIKTPKRDPTVPPTRKGNQLEEDIEEICKPLSFMSGDLSHIVEQQS